MTKILDAYTKEEFDRALGETLKRLLRDKVLAPTANPVGVLLGGQSGAGKTLLHALFKEQVDGNAIVINGDEFRSSHPQFHAIQQHYGMDAPAHTAKWAGQMTEALIDAFSRQKYNLIIEGTLRTSDVPLRTARLLRERGYDVSLAIMAVKPEISLVSCQIRYELMRIAGTTPRATDPAHHNKIINDIVDNLSTLEESGQFTRVYLYNRAAECLYPREGESSANAVLRKTLFGDWTEEERLHLSHLKQQLADLRTQ